MVFVERHIHASMANGLFYCEYQAQDSCSYMLSSSKNALSPLWHSPKKECLRHQAINLAPPERVRAWGQPPEAQEVPVLVRMAWMQASRNPCQVASTDCHWRQDTLGLIRVPRSMSSQSVSQLGDTQIVISARIWMIKNSYSGWMQIL